MDLYFRNNPEFMFFAGWSTHFFYVTKKGKCMAVGRNGDGELGLGYSAESSVTGPEPEIEPKEVKFFSQSGANSIADISTGFEYTIFKTAKNGVLTVGRNESGQISHGKIGKDHDVNIIHIKFDPEDVEFRKFNKDNIEFSKRIRKISAGMFSSYYLFRNGSVYAAGRNFYGELGIGESGDDVPSSSVALKTILPEKIVDIQGGRMCVFFLSKKKIYSCGWNEHFQLGHNTDQDVSIPTEVTYFKENHIDLKSIHIIENAVFFLTKSGSVYHCGDDTNSEFGYLGDDYSTSGNKIQLSKTIKNVKNMYANTEYGIVFKTNDGSFFTTGSISTRTVMRISVTDGTEDPNEPLLCKILEGKRICQVVCNYRNVYFITRDRDLYSQGSEGNGGLFMSHKIENIEERNFILSVKGMDLKRKTSVSIENKKERLEYIVTDEISIFSHSFL